MRSFSWKWPIIACLLILGVLACESVLAAAGPPGGRYALVIGNTDYGRDQVSGKVDAQDMAVALRDIGFTVLPPVYDANLEDMRASLRSLV